MFLVLVTRVPVATGQSPTLTKLWWNQYEITQSIFTLIVACLGGCLCYVSQRRRGTPYREEEPRSGKLELDDEVGRSHAQ
jgi:hypothetical protein